MKKETRNFILKELRSVADPATGKQTLTGYASVFNSRSENLGFGDYGFYEVVAPSAFTKTLQENRQIKALCQHDFGKVLGSVSSRTLRLTVDEIGLRAEVDLPDTTFAKDLAESVSRGDIDGMSFMFESIKDKWENDETTGETIRTLIEVKLYEVSFVAYPAYSATSVALRDLLTEDKINELYQARTAREQQEATQAESTLAPDFRPLVARSRFL